MLGRWAPDRKPSAENPIVSAPLARAQSEVGGKSDYKPRTEQRTRVMRQWHVIAWIRTDWQYIPGWQYIPDGRTGPCWYVLCV